ncbi:hypothetical protein [Kistimonas asteriae]|uniref:hypothetical protein n=1 Tax=Kistimonas asteriae TaxID=517724 RepID=UPI001BAB5085|nr:hypothetical protein [Kistimonas asteriae]
MVKIIECNLHKSVESKFVLKLFSLLNDSGVEYAILRNYEKFPFFSHDIDLVIDSKKIDKCRSILITVCESLGWDYLTECDHWSKSSESTFHINVFRAYHFESNTYIQIDLFNSLILLGLPIWDQEYLIESREYNKNNNIYHINTSIQNIYRMFQVNKLLQNRKLYEDKIERYRELVLKYSDYNQDFKNIVLQFFDQEMINAIEQLKNKNYKLFKKLMFRVRLKFFFKKIHSLKYKMLFVTFLRVNDYIRTYFTRQCGFIVNVYFSNAGDKNKLKAVLTNMQKEGFIYCWDFYKNNIQGIKDKHKVMERGGIVFKKVEQKDSDLCVTNETTLDDLRANLMKLLVNRHMVIFKKCS